MDFRFLFTLTAPSARNLTNLRPTLLQYRNGVLFHLRTAASYHLCQTKTKCCMILVLLSLIGFFGIFFWQAERLNHMAEKKHIDQPENPYLWPQKVSKHA